MDLKIRHPREIQMEKLLQILLILTVNNSLKWVRNDPAIAELMGDLLTAHADDTYCYGVGYTIKYRNFYIGIHLFKEKVRSVDQSIYARSPGDQCFDKYVLELIRTPEGLKSEHIVCWKEFQATKKEVVSSELKSRDGHNVAYVQNPQKRALHILFKAIDDIQNGPDNDLQLISDLVGYLSKESLTTKL